MKPGSDTAELRGGRRGEELTLTGGSRCQPDEERDKGCRVGRSRERKLPEREGEEKGKFPRKVSFLFFSNFMFFSLSLL